MKLNPIFPFEEYKCYKIFHKRDGRWRVHMRNIHTNKLTTILYAKYLKSIEVGRILQRHEEVDHIDSDKTNDDVSNIDIVTHEENIRRYSKVRTPKRMITLHCPNCEIEFTIAYNQCHLVKKTKNPTCCSRKCSGSYSHKV